MTTVTNLDDYRARRALLVRVERARRTTEALACAEAERARKADAR